MSNQEILTKAMDKAKENGWENETWVSVTIGTQYEVGTITTKHVSEYEWRDYAPIIFQKSFAKALWGEEERKYGNDGSFTGAQANQVYEVTNKGWQYHLKEMVISEDPIKYLGDNLPVDNPL